MENVIPDVSVLTENLTKTMPYGKYKGQKIMDLPVYYLEWHSSIGWPKGRLGMLLSTALIIKTFNLEIAHLLRHK
jgi:uncharacterized protein (DUF3820 family)